MEEHFVKHNGHQRPGPATLAWLHLKLDSHEPNERKKAYTHRSAGGHGHIQPIYTPAACPWPPCIVQWKEIFYFVAHFGF